MKTYVWHAQGGDYGGKFCGEVYAPTLEEASQKACAALDYEVQCSDCWSDEGESLVYSLRVEGPPECAWCDGDPVGLDEAGDAACAEHAVACGPLPEPEPWDAWEDLVTVDVDPDHDALIAAAGGDTNCDHRWTSEGEGGCDSNPGVWSLGGTALLISQHCEHCGLQRQTRLVGGQRNPGEHDTVTYIVPPDQFDEIFEENNFEEEYTEGE